MRVNPAIAIGDAIVERGHEQRQQAAVLGCVQPEVSALVNPRLAGFCVGRLTELLAALDRDVAVGIRQAQRQGSFRARDLHAA